jgi:hypothetical protein
VRSRQTGSTAGLERDDFLRIVIPLQLIVGA